MSSNQTFNPTDPQQALAMLDAILGGDNLNFNRAHHRAIETAIATLRDVIVERDNLALALNNGLARIPQPEAGPAEVVNESI